MKYLTLLLATSILLLQGCNKSEYTINDATMRLPIGAGTNSAAFFTFHNATFYQQAVR